MGWRDRMKKNFAYSAEIAYGDETVKTDKDNNKLSSKTSFSIYTQNTQNTQNTDSKVKDETSETINPADQNILVSELSCTDFLTEPADRDSNNQISTVEQNPSPDTDDIFNTTDVSNTNSPDLCDRAPIENGQDKKHQKNRTASHSVDDKNQGLSPSEKNVRVSLNLYKKQMKYSQANCPARCKRTGKCYGKAWYDGKPGSSRPCTPQQCPWAHRFKKGGEK